jgi:hypothetical protein
LKTIDSVDKGKAGFRKAKYGKTHLMTSKKKMRLLLICVFVIIINGEKVGFD